MIFGFLILTLGSNQVATGLALVIFGTGLSSLAGASYVGITIPSFDSIFPEALSEDPLGRVIFGYSPMVYFAFFAVFGVYWFLNRTRAGLVLRAVGENDVSARSIGYSVIGVRYAAIDDRRPRLDRARLGGVLGMALGAAFGGSVFLRVVHDLGILRESVRILLPSLTILGFNAVLDGRPRSRVHVRARDRRRRGPGLSRQAIHARRVNPRAAPFCFEVHFGSKSTRRR